MKYGSLEVVLIVSHNEVARNFCGAMDCENIEIDQTS